MTKDKEAKKITTVLYKECGSDSGYLLGIAPKYRTSVQAIVRFMLKYNEERYQNGS